jgi:hypothetical protein
LAIEGVTLVVGAPEAETSTGVATGLVFVYELDVTEEWALVSTLSPELGSVQARFGADVGIFGRTIIVGSPGWDASGESNNGAVRLYEHSDSGTGWADATRLGAVTTPAGGRLGEKVDIYGWWAAASQPGGERVQLYLFNGESEIWETGDVLLPMPSSRVSSFGDTGVDFTDGWLAIGSRHDSGAADNAGAAYLYTVSDTEVTFSAALAPYDAVAEALGGRVGFAGPNLIYGAPGQGLSGRVNVFSPCPAERHGPGCEYSCDDGEENGEEWDVDGGGPCPDPPAP